MKGKELSSLSKQITRFKSRKAQEFPELDIKVCTDYENYHSSPYPKHYRQIKQQLMQHI